MSEPLLTEPKFQISVSENMLPGIKGIETEFRRINVILGANGTGKSRILQHIAYHPTPELASYKIRYYDAYRLYENTSVELAQTSNNMNIFNNVDSELANHHNNFAIGTRNRLQHAVWLMSAITDKMKKAHSDAVEEWKINSRELDCPDRGETPLIKFARVLNKVSPHLQLKIDGRDLQVTDSETQGYLRSGQDLSSGEKQVLVTVADLLVFAKAKTLFIIDEPELGLHPCLAETLWKSVEEEFPDSIFIYATHCFPFATRPEVECIYLLGHGAIERSSLWDQSFEDAFRPLWGAVPLISRRRKCLFTEGASESLDQKFYTWLLQDDSVSVVPLGSCDNVLSACDRTGIWSVLQPGLQTVGVVDRDFEREISLPTNVIQLDFHEVESYICHPDLLASLAQKLGVLENTPTRESFLDDLCSIAETSLPQVVARRLNSRYSFVIRPSLPRKVTDKINTKGLLLELFCESFRKEIADKTMPVTEQALMKAIESVWSDCKKAIDDRDCSAILRTFEGKRFLGVSHARLGLRRPEQLLTAATKHHKPKDFPHLDALSKQLREKFS